MLKRDQLQSEYERFVAYVSKEPQYTDNPANQELVPGLKLLDEGADKTHECMIFDDLIVEQYLEAKQNERKQRLAKRLNQENYEQSETESTYAMKVASEVRQNLLTEANLSAEVNLQEDANLGKRSTGDEPQPVEVPHESKNEQVNRDGYDQETASVRESQRVAPVVIEVAEAVMKEDSQIAESPSSSQEKAPSTIIPEHIPKVGDAQPTVTSPVAAQQATLKFEIPLFPEAPQSLRHQVAGNPYKVLKLKFDDPTLDRTIPVGRLLEMVWEMFETTAAETNEAGSTLN